MANDGWPSSSTATDVAGGRAGPTAVSANSENYDPNAATTEGTAPASGGAGDKENEVLFHGWSQPVPYNYDDFNNRATETNWEGSAPIYEWDGETGDIGPEVPELELMLFGRPEDRQTGGIDFTKITKIKLYQEGPARVEPIDHFKDAKLHPAMLRNVEMAGYTMPTPIQKYCIPAINQGYDVIAIAQTGSGKTAAYLVPILNKLMGKAKKLAAPRPSVTALDESNGNASKFGAQVRAEPLVCIVCPTRELATQIFNEARKFCYRTMLRPVVLYGGCSMREQVQLLAKGCDILVATPGRLIDFMDRPHLLTMRRLKFMVIDEADEMLQDDWRDDFDKILSGGDQEEGNIQYMLFSATFPKAARDLAKTHLSETHVRLRVGRAGSSHENIKQNIILCEPSGKREGLVQLMNSLPPARTIIFVNNKRTADELDDFLFNHGVPCVSIHSDRTQKEREAAMRAFRRGESPVLIASGVTSRGIDVRNVMHVINYDLPSIDHGGIEEYTHRIGRTGRIGHRGLASSFFSERDEGLASVLTRTLLETNQHIPDFLTQYIPEGYSREKGENLKFEADSDWEEDAGGGMDDDNTQGGNGWGAAPAGGGGDAWGASSNDNPAASAWGAGQDTKKPDASGWGGNQGNTAASGSGWGADTAPAAHSGWGS